MNGWVFNLKTDPAIGVFRECSNPDCHFRYPDMRIEHAEDYCPKCGEPSGIRSTVMHTGKESQKSINARKAELIVLLDNIRSVYNVGSIFRTCDGLGIKEIYLAGITPTPDHPRLAKTGLGAEDQISWIYRNNTVDLVQELRERGFQFIGLECTEGAIPVQEFDLQVKNQPFCLISGNERLGIDPEIQKMCDALVCIPMSGVKESLNVSVAFAIAAFYLTDFLKKN